MKKKFVFRIGMGIVALVVVLGAINGPRLLRLYRVLHLFDADIVAENFQKMDDIFTSRTMAHDDNVFEFKRDEKKLPSTYTWQEEEKDIRQWLESVDTTGLIVVRDDTILYEEYWKGNSATTRHISWSAAKSIVSALFGIAMEEGYIDSVEDPVTNYVPALKESGYDNVRIKDVLQMSSGVRFNEDYGDFHSDINRMGRAFALNTPLDDFVASLENEREPGTYHHYVSMDTQVLGMIIREATGRTISDYMEEKLWKKIGTEADAAWLIDKAGMETVFGGLNAVLRDYARFGRLYLHKGNWGGQQVVPEDWIEESLRMDGPHLKPGEDNSLSNYPMGYGYQWWIPEKTDGDFLAIGIYGQAIYIYPKYNIVIARNGAFKDYNDSGDDMERESVEVYRAIARKMSRTIAQ